MSTSSNVIGRGVRIPRRSLDAFLQRHNLPPSHPGGLFEEDAEAISELFARLGVQGSKLRFLEPRLTNFKPADHLFLCYDWVYVLAEKEVEASLRKEGPPEGFWEVVREICGGGGGGGGDEARELKVGTWVLCIEKEWGLFQEKKFRDSETFRCGLCGDVLATCHTRDMFKHLEEVHQQIGWVLPPY